MFLKNQRALPWAQGAVPNLKVKNLLEDCPVGAGNVTCGVCRWPCGEAGKPHTHEATGQDELYIVLRGRGIACIGGEEKEIGPGDLFHAKCGEVHGMLRGLEPEGIELFYLLIPTERKEENL